MTLTRAFGLAIVAAACAVLVAAAFRGTIVDWSGGIVRQVADVFPGTEPTGRRVYGSKDDIGRSEESQITGMMDSVVSLATGASTSNFQEVRALAPTMSLSRLSRSVGMLIFTERTADGGTQSYSCTGFMISPRYLLTAAHCFFADPDRSKPAKLTDLEFVPNFVEPGTLSSIPHLKLKTQVINKETVFWQELACPGKACSLKGAEKDGHDFAVLELTEDSVAKARAAGVSEAILGDVGLGPQQQLVIFQHPGGGQMMFVERHCLTVGNIEAARPTREFFKHFCDTLGGSSGAPVFSRDHEVVVGLHVQGSRPFTVAERTSQSRANGAIHVSQIAAISEIVGDGVPVAGDPPTAEQRELIDYANQRGEQAQALLADGRSTLAAYVALDGLERFGRRSTSEKSYLFDRASRAQAGLGSVLSARTELMKFSGTGGAFMPDGRRLATVTKDAIEIFDLPSGGRLATLPIPARPNAAPWGIVVSPKGNRFVVGYGNDSLGLWDANSGRELSLHIGEAAIFSRDGLRVATETNSQTIVWDAITGKQLLKLPGKDAQFAPAGDRLLTVVWADAVRIWDAGNGREIMKLAGHADKSTFSPDGRRIATANGDTVRVFDAASGRELWKGEAHTSVVNDLEFSRDGKLLVAAMAQNPLGLLAGLRPSENGTTLWDAITGRRLLTLRGHASGVHSATFSVKGDRILTEGDGTARVWDVTSGNSVLKIRAEDCAVQSAAFSPVNDRILAECRDGTIGIWAPRTGQEALKLTPQSANIWSTALSPDGKRLVATFQEGIVRVWNSENGRELFSLKHESQVRHAEYSRQGGRIVTASMDGTARVWDANSGRQLLLLQHSGDVNTAAFSPDGTRIATVGGLKRREIRVWSATTGQLLATFGELEGSALPSIAFSDDGLRLTGITGSGPLVIAHVWDSRDGRQLAKVDIRADWHGAKATGRRLSPDGTRILGGLRDNTAGLWETMTGRKLAVLRGHLDRVEDVAFSFDGRRVVTTSLDGTARVWDARTGRELLVLRGHEGFVHAAAVSRDGRRISTAAVDGSIRIWHAWRAGVDLLEDAYCRLRFLKPTEESCSAFGLDCSRDRKPAETCDPTSAPAD